MNYDLYTFGSPGADTLLLQMVDDHDLDLMEQEVAHIRRLTGENNFCLKALKVKNWFDDLSPWKAPPVFGNEPFGDGAERMLAYLLGEVLSAETGKKAFVPAGAEMAAGAGKEAPVSAGAWGAESPRIFIGGYSLAGLFALWAGYQTDRFDGVAAASPSVWFPHFTGYMREHTLHAEAVYLSLGDREERTGNPVMAKVGDAIRESAEILDAAGTDCVLEWNQGNHFKEPDLRTAKAFAWLMRRRRG